MQVACSQVELASQSAALDLYLGDDAIRLPGVDRAFHRIELAVSNHQRRVPQHAEPLSFAAIEHGFAIGSDAAPMVRVFAGSNEVASLVHHVAAAFGAPQVRGASHAA